MKNQVWWAHPECARWSNRLLIGSLIGIGYLTLFPFQFNFGVRHSSYGSPFLLGETLKQVHHLDVFLNILLFIPFGFAISCQLCKRNVSLAGGLILALASGTLASYVVEVLQYYIPTRNSAWDDVAPNSIGALVGFLIFEICGAALLRKLSEFEEISEEWLSPPRTAMVLVVYFALCFAASILLQQQTRLSDWDAQCSLFVGNDGSGKNPWKGQVSHLQVWDHAIPEGLVQQMTTEGQGPVDEPGLLASYDFTTTAPYLDQKKFLPALAWASTQPPSKNDGQGLEIDGTSWLGTTSPVGELNRKIQ
jgi:glycopeptide antibiotics resistance protein